MDDCLGMLLSTEAEEMAEVVEAAEGRRLFGVDGGGISVVIGSWRDLSVPR